MRHAEVPCKLANGEARAAHLRDLRDRRAAPSAARRPEANARRAQPGAYRRWRDPKARRDPVGPNARAVRGLEIGVGDTVTDRLLARQSRSLCRREAGPLDEIGSSLGRAANGFGAAPLGDRRVI